MNDRYDAIVVGVGAMGSAALYHLARRGLRVLGIDQHGIAHDRGSSHGESRILRLAYFEHPSYVPLARRALSLWRALERESGERLFVQTGGLDGGPEDDPIFTGSLESCRLHDLEHDVLDGSALRKRFPAFRVPRDYRFVFQPDAGVLHPERCIEAHARMAEALGADIITGHPVLGWTETGGGLEVEVEAHRPFRTDAVVLTAGAWTSGFLPEDGPRLRVERQVTAWLTPADPEAFRPERFPVFNMQIAGGHHYGFPVLEGRGPKVGRFGHLQEETDPDTLRRDATAADRSLLQGFADLHLRGAGAIADTAPCMFTYSDDTDFVVDRIPGTSVVIGCGFSGHGFKFASVIGQALAGLAVGDDPDPHIEHLRWGRSTIDPPGS
ncbi:MAG: N-methyl-L-tryptophan oxidase [Gemmatimonadetes bacterium]|nr:N-methyl-L-tryptophan oxidase [Gemmatimonadota bacterium]NNK63104.1 N-methyl-L-tryptophan oxidase [Gemmatimonadota bacterium]